VEKLNLFTIVFAIAAIDGYRAISPNCSQPHVAVLLEPTGLELGENKLKWEVDFLKDFDGILHCSYNACERNVEILSFGIEHGALTIGARQFGAVILHIVYTCSSPSYFFHSTTHSQYL